jgi:hypothetical protein
MGLMSQVSYYPSVRLRCQRLENAKSEMSKIGKVFKTLDLLVTFGRW